MLSKFKRLPGLNKFAIIWNPAWLLITAYLAITMHSGFELALMVLFGAFTVHAFYAAKWELARQDLEAQLDREFEEALGEVYRNKTRK